MTTVSLFSNLVVGIGGWYIDEDTCTPPMIEFLEEQLKRSLFAHANLATTFGPLANGMSEELQQLVLQVLGSPDPIDATTAIAAARVFFAGGNDPTREGNPYIYGLSNWYGAVPRGTTLRYPNGLVAWSSQSYSSFCVANQSCRSSIAGQTA